jgi:hypothetical protein
MKPALAIALSAAAVVFAPGLASAQQYTGINNEVVCAGPGSGMDPRCVGETNPGTWTDFLGSAQTQPLFIYRRPLPLRR